MNKMALQRAYCVDKDEPWFMPWDGRCDNCGNDILEKYSEEECKTTRVRRCRHCNRSLSY